ncbi:MAG: GGDEF domain-containing protein [Eubacterium sp.]|nr:GGDEF domain-containing protein [Eubacterium sp.]
MFYKTGMGLDIYSIVILCILLLSATRKTLARDRSSRYFVWTIVVLLIIEICNVIASPNFLPDQYEAYKELPRLILFLLDPFVQFMWLLYAASKIEVDFKNLRKWIWPVGIVELSNIVVIFLNIRTGWIYKVATDDAGTRGPYFLVRAAIMILIVPYVEYFLFHFRKRLTVQNFMWLVLFPAVPMIGGIFQAAIPDFPALENVGMVIALLTLYIFVQDHDSNTDSLTGCGNRRILDIRLDKHIEEGRKDFGLLMIDVDQFKQINDTYGHAQGDMALQILASLLMNRFGRSNRVARYGGDEFCVVVYTESQEELDAEIEKLRLSLESFNRLNRLPYRLEISIGSAIYHHGTGESAGDFVKRVDRAMYIEKAAHKKMRKENQPK